MPQYAVTREFRARELFTLVPDQPRTGLPAFANLKAVPTPFARTLSPDLDGPGIYGKFVRGRLTYVGIHSGADKVSFGHSVTERWFKHLTYQALRSPNITFAAANLDRILRDPDGVGGPFDAFAQALGGRDRRCAGLTHQDHPLVQKSGASCTYNKARYARMHWDVFAPGNEETMLDQVSFLYARLLPEPTTIALLEGAGDDAKARYGWVKDKWLAVREKHLYRTLRPICNHQTTPGRERPDVTVAEFRRELEAQMALPLSAFPNGILKAA